MQYRGVSLLHRTWPNGDLNMESLSGSESDRKHQPLGISRTRFTRVVANCGTFVFNLRIVLYGEHTGG